jgi:ssDNA-binding Zn-finger/Zn-ribbon topoisomerase 1
MENTELSAIPEIANQAVDTHEKKTPQESFAELRKAKEDLERQVWQAQQEKVWMEKQLQQQQLQQAPKQTQDEDYDFRQLEQEDFPDGKKLVKAFSTMNKKMSGYEQKLVEKETYLKALETKLEFPDFAEVVTAENIEKYIKSDEDNRESVEKASNPLRKVYNLIKKDARYQNDLAAKKKPTSISQEQKRVDEKENKPQIGSLGVRSAAVTTAAQMSNSTMTKDQRNALWKETMAAARK